MKLLLIEDDRKLADAIERGLTREGYIVDRAHNGEDGSWMAIEGTFDVIILDIMLPKRNGYLVCADVRAADVWTPILMLTAKDGEYDETEGLDTGADDYLVKPFSFEVLLARLRALIRRGASSTPPPLTVGDLRLDSTQRRVWRGSTEIILTARQFDLLEFLVRRVGQVLSKVDLLNGVWSHDFDGDPNIVEVYIRRLRVAIDEPFDRQSIETIRGAGYRLVEDRTS